LKTCILCICSCGH